MCCTLYSRLSPTYTHSILYMGLKKSKEKPHFVRLCINGRDNRDGSIFSQKIGEQDGAYRKIRLLLQSNAKDAVGAEFIFWLSLLTFERVCGLLMSFWGRDCLFDFRCVIKGTLPSFPFFDTIVSKKLNDCSLSDS